MAAKTLSILLLIYTYVTCAHAAYQNVPRGPPLSRQPSGGYNNTYNIYHITIPGYKMPGFPLVDNMVDEKKPSPALKIIGQQFQLVSKAGKGMVLKHELGSRLLMGYMPRTNENGTIITHPNERDSLFDIVPGLSGEGISIRSVNYPGRFVRQYTAPHGHIMCRLSPCPYGWRNRHKLSNFKREASWIPEIGVFQGGVWGISFRSYVNRSDYMMSWRNRVTVGKVVDGGTAMKATWVPTFT